MKRTKAEADAQVEAIVREDVRRAVAMATVELWNLDYEPDEQDREQIIKRCIREALLNPPKVH